MTVAEPPGWLFTRDSDPTIIGILGRRRSGKTTLAVAIALTEHRRNDRPIKSNMPLAFPHDRFKVPKFFGEKNRTEDDAVAEEAWWNSMDESVIVLDEPHRTLDSHFAASKRNTMASYLWTQIGKRGIDVLYTAQHWMQPDTRLREQTDYVVHVTKVNETHSLLRFGEAHGRDEGSITWQRGVLMWFDRRPYHDLFNSWHVITDD